MLLSTKYELRNLKVVTQCRYWLRGKCVPTASYLTKKYGRMIRTVEECVSSEGVNIHRRCVRHTVPHITIAAVTVVSIPMLLTHVPLDMWVAVGQF